MKPLSRLFWTVWCLAKAGAFLGWLAIQSLPTMDDAARVWCRIQPPGTRC
jgi:hypothetical protein